MESDDIRELTDLIIEEEKAVRDSERALPDDGRWLLGLTYFDQKSYRWQEFGQEIRAIAESSLSGDSKRRIVDIADRLV